MHLQRAIGPKGLHQLLPKAVCLDCHVRQLLRCGLNGCRILRGATSRCSCCALPVASGSSSLKHGTEKGIPMRQQGDTLYENNRIGRKGGHRRRKNGETEHRMAGGKREAEHRMAGRGAEHRMAGERRQSRGWQGVGQSIGWQGGGGGGGGGDGRQSTGGKGDEAENGSHPVWMLLQEVGALRLVLGRKPVPLGPGLCLRKLVLGGPQP